MGDKQSVEAKPDVDDYNLYHCIPVNPQDDEASVNSCLTDCELNGFDDTAATVASIQPDVLVNGVWHSSHVNTPFAISTPECKMKQSKSAHHSVNGATAASAWQDTRRSLSVEAKLMVTDEHPVDNDVTEHCTESSCSETSAAAADSSVQVEPSSPSTSSTVTVVSVVHTDNEGKRQKSGRELSASSGRLPADCSGSSPARYGADMLAPKDRTKHTLGDVLAEIESRSASLLQQTNYSTPTAIADLQFLAYQSRYSTDLNIKRRIITKLVDSGLIDIIVHVLSSVHEADCFQTGSEISSIDGASLTGSAEVDPEMDMLDGMKNLRSVITLSWNATDKSPLLCEQCVRRGIISMLLQLLENPHLAVAELHDKNRLFIVKGSLGILGSIVRACDDDMTHEVFRSAGVAKTLQQFLRCSLLAVRTKSLIILSYIATESENDVIHASDKNLMFAVKMLQSALESDNHYSSKYGYWAIEILSGVNRLAGFELNKERLFAAGLLSLCFQLLDGSCTDDEILVATQTFWILSFSSVVRAEVKASHLYMHVLEQLSTNHTREEIKRTAASVVWMINYYSSSRISSPTASASAAAKETESNNRVLIISHHTSGQIVLKIRSHLRSAGYRVHIDPDMRSGSSGMETLVENVDRSAVVLVFLSNRLKNSAACRSALWSQVMLMGGAVGTGEETDWEECLPIQSHPGLIQYKSKVIKVEYALNADKAVVPVRIHRSYILDGWLSASLASHSVLNFTDTEDFDAGMTQLLHRVSAITGPVLTSEAGGSESRLTTSPQCVVASHNGSVDITPSPATPVTSPQAAAASPVATPTSSPASAAVSNVLSWSRRDVRTWLRDNDLDSLTERFHDMNGRLLLEVRRMQALAPESFYTSLRADLSLDFVTMLKFSQAVSSLGESTN